MKPVLSTRLSSAPRDVVNPPTRRRRNRQPGDFRVLASHSQGRAGCVERPACSARIRAGIPLLGSIR